MKSCLKCKEEKPEDDFRWKDKTKGLKTARCKSCLKEDGDTWRRTPQGLEKRNTSNREGSKRKRLRNAQFVWDYLSSHPRPCGESDPVVLEFDHRDPSEKKYTVSFLTSGCFAIATIEREIAKCDVLCVMCHRRKTAVQCGWYSKITRK